MTIIDEHLRIQDNEDLAKYIEKRISYNKNIYDFEITKTEPEINGFINGAYFSIVYVRGRKGGLFITDDSPEGYKALSADDNKAG